jgi:nitrite reductase (NO-forming)
MTDTQARPVAARPASPWPKTAIRIAFGVVWLVDAALKWTTHFRADYIDHLKEGSDGRPSWLDGWFRFWIDLQNPHPYFWAYLVASVETLIAVAILIGFARKLSYTAALAFSLLIWATAEGFGGPYTGASADVDAGAGIIYVLVFASLLAFAYYLGTSRYSVDYYLEQRISWWHWVAEVGRRNHPRHQTTATGAARPATPAPVPTPLPH